MDDDDIEVIEELNVKRAADQLVSNSYENKKARLDGSFLAVTKDVPPKYNGDAVKTVLLQLSLVKDLPNLILPDTEKIFQKQCSETRIASSRADTSLTKMISRKLRIDNFLSRANYLINFPVNANCATSANFGRTPNGLHPVSTYSQNNVHPNTVLKEQSNVDGLQIVSMIAGKAERNLPPPGLLKHVEPTLNTKVYAMKTDLFGVWFKAVIVNIKEGNEKMYKVKFEGYHKLYSKTCSAKQIAYEHPSDVRLPFGKRIIAFYKPEEKNGKSAMYAGIVAEPPKSTNRYRYLVFFDDGFAQYIEHSDIRLVYEESKNVWEDIHPDTRDFIKSYCEQFPERPMLKLQKNQVVKTEFNSEWWHARVVDIDASMVKMYFEAENRYEWIYRGSTRLAPLFNELEKAKHNRMTGKVRRHNITTRRINENQPYVEYTRTFDEIVLDSDGSDSDSKQSATPEKPVRRNVAKKSTTQIKKVVPDVPDTSDVRNNEGELYFITLPSHTRVKFSTHNCGPNCKEKGDPVFFKGKNPLRIPMYLGWERHFKKFRQRGYNSVIQYRTPCGKTLRNLGEVTYYLFLVKSKLTIDMFTFDPQLCPFQSFRTAEEETLWSTDDITYGKENVPIECVNCLSSEKPLYVEYATERFPGKGVTLNLDEEFLCGCDCTDNCQDPLKCQCRQLTIKAYSKDGSVTDVGYNYRRLTEPIVTGIYECNSRCKCGPSCMNRVVQNGLQIRLQMFKTAKKGWGIRCLDDIDAGMFLCIYAGQLLTEQGADEDGHQFGDEYLAELDHIEVAEKMKEGYESDVPVDIDLEETPIKDEPAIKEISESDDESDDVSSYKSNSSSQNSNSQDSDPEYEGRIESSMGQSSYVTRSKNKAKTKKKFALFSSSEFNVESDDSSTCTASETSNNSGMEKKELPDLTSQVVSQKLLLPRPLSPTTAEEIEKLEITRKPKVEPLSDTESEKARSKFSGVTKKSQSLSKPLPPPKPIEEKPNKYMSVRSYFNEDYCYIMDAKSKGNIGRYLNHSCFPNSFVQNVFLDTHDLRFPTVAFFASDRIKAGTELTWDYNYEVGSVQNKVLYCHCESKNCRGRLL